MATPYHHGDLPRALLAAVAELVERDGVGGVSIRAVAREVGVSHSAPLHHFGDKQGLLTAFALEGYLLFADALERAAREHADLSPVQRLGASGRAYLDFAIRHRAHFEVMFRPELVDDDDDALTEAGERSFQAVIDAVAACRPDAPDEEVEGLALAAWSTVHGLATLWVDGPLPHMTERDRDTREDLDAVAGPVLDALGRAVTTS